MSERIHEQFRARVAAGDLPDRVTDATLSDAGWSAIDLGAVFSSQVESRALDLTARAFGRAQKTFYSIGSAGHEGNAAVARVLRRDDMAFLHYRSGAFLIERMRAFTGSRPMWDMALSFAAASEDPCSGGRHKVLGSRRAFVPPQTSTIASHLPKAVGFAHAITLARTQKKDDATAPLDGLALASFGDASANHATAQTAFNAAAWAAHRSQPVPIIFLCEDNGVGISVPTPEGWIASTFSSRPGLEYLACDGRDVLDVARVAQAAQSLARARRRPVFLHMRTVRLMGHAGSDVESAYRDRAEIEAAENDDPLLHTVAILEREGVMTRGEALDLYDDALARAERVMEAACQRPKLTTAREVARPIVPKDGRDWAGGRGAPRAAPVQLDTRARAQAQPLARAVALTLSELMGRDRDLVVFGEDVGKKGGVYGATFKLQELFGRARVFDTLLDEQTILGLAIGLAQNGFIPVPEIQFLAYLHNAEDQLRGEAATLSFFSEGAFTNPMIVRIAGLGYQRGFGGHFHNDNALAVLRDIPGLMVACPSSAQEAIGLLRESWRLAREEGRVVVHLEPIALYGTRDLHEEGDGLMLASLDEAPQGLPVGALGVHGDGADVSIVTYGNGVMLSRRAARTLEREHGLRVQVIDLRWLRPLPIEAVRAAVAHARAVLVVDECRKTGSPSEEIITGLVEGGWRGALARVTAVDSFIPLGPAAYAVLPSVEEIVQGVRDLAARMESRP